MVLYKQLIGNGGNFACSQAARSHKGSLQQRSTRLVRKGGKGQISGSFVPKEETAPTPPITRRHSLTMLSMGTWWRSGLIWRRQHLRHEVHDAQRKDRNLEEHATKSSFAMVEMAKTPVKHGNVQNANLRPYKY